MRAELIRKQEMVAFVWDNGYVMEGQILVYRYDTPFAGVTRHFDIPADKAKAYWNILVHNGFRRALLHPSVQR